MSNTITKTLTVTPITIETKELASKKTGEPYQKVEITCELPSAGKVYMKAWPEDCGGLAPGVPFEAEVTATPRLNGGYFYDFKPVRVGVSQVPHQAAPAQPDASQSLLGAFQIATFAKLDANFGRIHEQMKAIMAHLGIESTD